MERYTVTIKDHETGEITEIKTNTIIGSCRVEKGCKGIFLTYASKADIAYTVAGVLSLLEETVAEVEPFAYLAGLELYNGGKKEEKEGEN